MNRWALRLPKNVDEQLIDKERDTLFYRLIDELPETQRRRFLLHFAYGYTYMEIAEMEGSNKSTVMRSARAALKKIQKKLAA